MNIFSFLSPLISYWYFFIIVFILGILFSVLLRKKILKLLKFFTQRTKLLKKYWLFILSYIIFSILGYLIIFIFFTEDKSLYITIYQHILTIIFAIFVGYFAFLQVVESRLDKLIEEGDLQLRAEDYQRAADAYERCMEINSDDFRVWANLLEIYLILERYSLFDEKLIIAKNKKKYSDEEVLVLYLEVAKDILQERLRDAKEGINEIISYIQANPEALQRFRWKFSDMEKSRVFLRLGNETQSIYKSLAKYLLGQLTPEEKASFESGTYELTPRPASASSSARHS